jgi:polyhydroxyalkanoate synthesis regulator phasin
MAVARYNAGPCRRRLTVSGQSPGERSLREVAEELVVRARSDARWSIEAIARDFGLVTRDELDELALRVAQLEHRLRLLEDRQA